MNDMQNLNGYIFTTERGMYRLPPELLQTLLSHFDHETLLNCQLVCKSWLEDIRNEVWRMKAEMKFGKKLLRYNFSWRILYFMCKTENPFEKNLLKNHSGEIGFQYWGHCGVFPNESGHWAVENPPVDSPQLPVDEDPIFEGKQFCFTSPKGKKCQIVKLLHEGFHPYLLDNFQLSIEISEWSCDPYKEIEYNLTYANAFCEPGILKLEKEDVEQKNKWIKKTYNIQCTERSLREILFGNHLWKRCKISGSCLKVKFPYINASDSSSDSFNDL